MDLEKRIRMAAESILENEALREGLNDDAAAVLIDWGVARAKQIAEETTNLEDDEEANEAAYPRMRGLRKILSAAAGLCAENLEPARQAELLQQIADQVPLVYDTTTTFDEANNWTNVPITKLGNPVQIITHLRTSIEKNAKDPGVQPSVIIDTEKKEFQKEPETKKRNPFFDWFSKN